MLDLLHYFIKYISVSTLLLTACVVYLYTSSYHRVDVIDYFDFFSDFILVVIALFILTFLSKIEEPKKIKNILMLGFFLLYFSLLNDTLDEILVIPNFITNIFEDSLQVIGAITISFGVYQWLKHNKLLNKKLEVLSSTDSLTGILNRRSFNEKFNAEFERSKRYKKELFVMLIDIDLFKKINDNYGHGIGDIVLNNLCDSVSKHLRINDVFCRWGGDEFFILAPETSMDKGQLFSEKVRLLFSEKPISLESGAILDVTVSIGCTVLQENDKSIETLIERADQALYSSKRKGRNVVSYSP